MMVETNSVPAVILDTRHSPFACLKPVNLKDVHIDGGFWDSRFQLNQTVTLSTQYDLLESTGRLDNFLRASGRLEKPFQGFVFNDSDVYKWLEAASWTMVYNHGDELHQLVDHVIDLISAAQDKDGYLNTYFSLDKAGERWSNLQDMHELYCAGHLIQAAIAHKRVTGEDKLFNVAIRLADHLYSMFGPSRREGSGGHPEVEMALIELYRTTGEVKYLNLASLLISRRGYGLLGGREYLLDHLPFNKLQRLAGHAVRALYLCSGVTDLALETGDQQLLATLERLWSTTVNQQMYVTGGMGAKHDGEAFGEPYELPNATAYAETFAAVASVMWNWRLLQLEGKLGYADLLEWTLYNAVLPGISLGGTEYFYVNPLADNGNHRRQPWFDCACCPPNINRTIAMLPGYIYSVSAKGIWLHLYVSSRINLELVGGQHMSLHQITSYPWDGHVTIVITANPSSQSEKDDSMFADPFSLFLRVPGWLGDGQVDVKINGETFVHHTSPGSYMEIQRIWQIGDNLEITFPMDVRYIESHPMVAENSGRIAFARGPLVYCLEEVDNPDVSLARISIDTSIQPTHEYVPELLGGVVQLRFRAKVNGMNKERDGKLYRPIHIDSSQRHIDEIEVKSIPYYPWANRKPGAMQVWHSFY